MTLRTVSGPTIAAALADARRLFGADAVMLQSTPPAGGQPASVTVAFDEAPPVPRPAPAAPARPEAAAPAGPRAYGYGAARKVRPATPAAASAPATAAPPPPASATAAEVAELRARLAALESLLSQSPPAPTRRPALVLVGPAGSGKSTLALRLGRTPQLLDAEAPAVLVVAPEEGLFFDPASAFWGTGVPVAVVRTEADVRDALATFAEADQIIVDTPSLPLRPDRAKPFVDRLATLLAPLAPLDVHFVADASRPAALTSEDVAALGLRPDALALTRLDEAGPDAVGWLDRLTWPLHFTSAGTGLADVAASESVPTPAAPRPVASAPPPPAAAPPRLTGSDYLDTLLSAPEARPPVAAEPARALVFPG